MTTMEPIKNTIQGHDIIPINDVTDIETLLEIVWPEGWVKRQEFFDFFEIDSPVDRNQLISYFGQSNTLMKKADLADFLWDRSNVVLADKNENF